MESPPAHKITSIRYAVEVASAQLVGNLLHSLDFDPVTLAFSNLNALLRKVVVLTSTIYGTPSHMA